MPDLMTPQKKPYTAVKVAVVTSIAAAAGGWVAWNQYGGKVAANATLREKSKTAELCEQERKELSLAKTELTAQVDEYRKRTGELASEKETTATQLSEKSGQLQAKEGELQASKVELEDLRRQRAELEKRLQAFRDLTAKFQKLIDSGKLQVMVRDGRMVVKLPAGILFDSGKAELSKDGQMAIMEVAVILKQFPDRKFMVAGHTDSVPATGTGYKSNWELSTARAVNVTQFFVAAGMKAENLVAAGYGEHDPVKSNKTDAGRRENRRIEIVLLPNLDELPPMPAELADKEKDKAP